VLPVVKLVVGEGSLWIFIWIKEAVLALGVEHRIERTTLEALPFVVREVVHIWSAHL
jgi:hypothetical protein